MKKAPKIINLAYLENLVREQEKKDVIKHLKYIDNSEEFLSS